jgi:hypothetical protein
MIPTWLARAIADRDGAPLGARHAKPNLCARCSSWTLLGLDGDVLAHTARVDPTPLSAQGELVALLTSRRTWTLTRTGRHLALDDRDPWRTAGRPPGARNATYAVLPQHRCGTTLTGHLLAPWPAALTRSDRPTPRDLERLPY